MEVIYSVQDGEPYKFSSEMMGEHSIGRYIIYKWNNKIERLEHILDYNGIGN